MYGSRRVRHLMFPGTDQRRRRNRLLWVSWGVTGAVPLGTCVVSCVLSKGPTPRQVELQILADLPVGSSRAAVEDYLRGRGIRMREREKEKRRPCSNRDCGVETYLPRAAGRAVFVKLSEDRVPEPRGHSLSSVWSSSRHTGASGE